MASPTVQLSDGTRMPWVAFGSGSKHRDTDASKHVAGAIQAGFRHIDCAQMYGNEESVGRGIGASGVPRADLYVTTKLDKLAPGSTVSDSLKASLEKLRMDYVDLFLVHVPVMHPDLEGVWRGMEACVSEGLTRSIGVSNFSPVQLERVLQIATIPPVVNQIELHPYVWKACLPALRYMKKRNVLATSYGGLASLARFSGGPVDPILPAIATRLSQSSSRPVTEAQVLQLWLRKKGLPYVTTTAKMDRMIEYLDSIELPDITDEEESRIDAAGSEAHHRHLCPWMDEAVADELLADSPRL